MNRFFSIFILSALFSVNIIPSVYAQDQSRFNQAIATLEEYAAQIPSSIAKIIRCARGAGTCTQAEITQARAIIALVGAALGVAALGIGTGVVAKVKGWGPFRKIGELAPPTPKITVTSSDVGLASRSLVTIYKNPVRHSLESTKKTIQLNIDTIDAAINEGTLPIGELQFVIPGTDNLSIANVIKWFVDQNMATSKYIQKDQE
jgi:hypothetical protein